MADRVVCQFSCGAASAVATKLAIAEHGDQVVIVNAFIQEEHPDNRRFLADCEAWFGRPIVVLQDTKYQASTLEVFRREQYLKGIHGAPCSRALKQRVLDAFRRPDDLMVMGFTVEEQDRYISLQERLAPARVLAPLIRHGLGKADCFAMIERAGIELPAMYRLGYHNANCIGCVKGGKGYWNKIRVDFPERFEEMATIQEGIGATAYLFRDQTGQGISLRELSPDAGNYPSEPTIACSFFCEMAETLTDSVST